MSDVETASKSDDSATPRRKSHRKLIITLIVLLVVLVLGGGAVYAGSQMLLGPSEGTIVNQSSYTQAPAKPAVEWEQFEGTYFTFDYPNTYTVQPPNKDDAISLETHTFVASGLMNKILAITVSKLPSGKLEDDASYYMRSLHPDIYSLKSQTVQGEKVVVATSNQDSQQAAFWAHGTGAAGRLLTFTISGASVNSPDTTQEYQRMLQSVKWR